MEKDKEKLFKEYEDYQEYIHDLIRKTIGYFGYLDGMKARFPTPKEISWGAADCAKDIIYQFQTAICLNIYKLFFDEGKDVYSLANYKHKADNYYGKPLSIKKPRIKKSFKNTITDFRKKIIAHSINVDGLSILMSDLFVLLKDAIFYYNQLTDEMLFGKERLFTDLGIENWINHSKNGLIELLNE